MNAPEPPARSVHSPASRNWRYPRQPRLLVVDDQPLHIQLMHRALPAEYQIFMATNGTQALAVAKEKLPDLILLDVEMPGMNGFDVLHALQASAETEDIPVIFVTAHTDGPMEAQGLEAGAVDFITKPINASVVRARVHTHLQLKFQSDFLRQWVYIDGLTGAFNRRYFDEHLATEWARAQRQQAPLSVVILDVDHFKAYNDHYGHLQGDEALRTLVATVKDGLLRPGDLLCRYGGEEFVCLLPNTNLFDARHVAERLRAAVQAASLEHRYNPPYNCLTISLGVAERNEASSAAALVALADEHLYRAKQSGKNKVVI